MSNQKFQNVLNNVPQNCPPIWFMRQAGRYHDHYQELKKSYTFETLCKTPELAAETALGPMRDFDFDVSILFSDILFPLEALGFDLVYNPGPQLSPKLLDGDFINNLKPVEDAVDFLSFQSKAVQCTRELLPKDKSLIGFIGGAWTLFTYAIEGSHKGDFLLSKNNINAFQKLSEKLIPVLSQSIKNQLSAGAELVMIFDTSAGGLSPLYFNTLVKPAVEKLANEFPHKLGYYCKNSTFDQINILQDLPLAGRGYDHRFKIESILRENNNGFVQGNFDQALFFQDKENFLNSLHDYLAPIKELSKEERSNWVCGLGHGVLPKTPQDNVKLFIETIRNEFS